MTIFVDMDDVMADTCGKHISQYNLDFNECLTLEECQHREVWQSVPTERQQSVRDHAHTDGFFRDLEPLPNSIEVLQQLADQHEVYIASAAMQFPNSLREKSDWLDEHFPFIPWQQRILCGHKHMLHGDVLIDDRSYNLKHFKGRGLLFTSGHNLHETEYERVNSWLEVAKLLL